MFGEFAFGQNYFGQVGWPATAASFRLLHFTHEGVARAQAYAEAAGRAAAAHGSLGRAQFTDETVTRSS